MMQRPFPVIDPVATGANILRLRREKGLSVRDVQRWFNFEEPRAIYKWQSGRTLPTVDNLYALSALLEVPMNDILVGTKQEPQEISCGSCFCMKVCIRRIPCRARFPASFRGSCDRRR